MARLGPVRARPGPGFGLASLRFNGLSSLAGRRVYKGVARRNLSLSAYVTAVKGRVSVTVISVIVARMALSALIVVQYGRIVL